jgi:hypothetical protein
MPLYCGKGDNPRITSAAQKCCQKGHGQEFPEVPGRTNATALVSDVLKEHIT